MSADNSDVREELLQLQKAVAAITRKLAADGRLVLGGAADPHKAVLLCDDLKSFGWPSRAMEIPNKGDK
jgi:hypothetical protein